MITQKSASTTDLAATARRIRRQVITMSHRAKAPHVASALSCVDLLVALYFHTAKLDPDNPMNPDRDRIILSKGHACAALYACLREFGFLSSDHIDHFAQNGSFLALHPNRNPTYGIEATTGSLGHGLGLGTGMALAAQIDQRPYRVFVILSDGECNEGSVWEAAMWAPAHSLGNLTAIVDFNKLQATGPSTEIASLSPLADKWTTFGWDAIEVDGHDLEELTQELAVEHPKKPRAIIAHTTKGKGVSFMENEIEWHYRPPSDSDLGNALDQLRDAP